MSDESALTAYCGLYCEDCIRYKSKASELAQNLLEEFKRCQFSEYAAIKSSSAKQLDGVQAFAHLQKCCEALQAVAEDPD